MPTPYPFAAVLFDLDGVLIDTTELHYRVWDEFARARGYAPTRSELFATNGRRAEETIRAWFGAALDDPSVLALGAEREAHYHRLLASEPCAPVPGVRAFLEALKARGVPRAVATSAVPENADLSLASVGMQGMFDAVITAADVRRGKPDPEPYLKAAAALGAPASACVVIEDSLSGVRSAKASGARCIALTTSFPSETLAAERPDWLIADFRELPPELRP